MLRSVIVIFCAELLWALVGQVNHGLAPAHVYFFVGGLSVTAVALTLPLRSGAISSFIIGLIYDCTVPITFGTHALIFTLAHTIIFYLRDRLPREETAGRVFIALLVNLGIFLIFSLVQVTPSPAPSVWPRLVVDLICSQILLVLVAPWFFAFQHHALVLARVEPQRLH